MAPLATSAFVSSLRAIPHLPANSWYYLASVAFAVLNRPAEIPLIYTLASSPSSLPQSSLLPPPPPPPSSSSSSSFPSPTPPPPGDDDVLNRTREALLKAAAIGGLPSTINALNALRGAVAPELLDAPSPANRTRRWNTSDGDMCIPADGGERLWDSIYGKVGLRVMRNMRRSYDDLGAVAQLVYAGVLAPDTVLGKRETGFVLVAGLVTGGDAWAAQLKGHHRYASPSSSSSSI